ncbi:nitroreductase family protein [Caproiciproducens sp.]|uniref:nitroreductase family protein n=1 Tax=Caproiciproducens sp. TaxID=1954376 RepID=UPI0028973C57|nr:nitroreductase family protein [Caproiciproducens sp.]
MEKNAVIEAIIQRRSIRKYSSEQVADEILEQIVETGRFAPSGGNNQSSHFMIIQSRDVLAQLKELVENEFAKMEIRPDTYQSIKSSILQSQKGGYDFTYNAPTFIIMANRQGYGNAMADCAVALENMMLAAVSLGVGSCWINQLHWLDDNQTIRQYLYQYGLQENETICGGLSLGYALQKELPPSKRTGNPVTYIR